MQLKHLMIFSTFATKISTEILVPAPEVLEPPLIPSTP